jgi:hypothetical protein
MKPDLQKPPFLSVLGSPSWEEACSRTKRVDGRRVITAVFGPDAFKTAQVEVCGNRIASDDLTYFLAFLVVIIFQVYRLLCCFLKSSIWQSWRNGILSIGNE